jgi:TP901 family phage tail tape measure protein
MSAGASIKAGKAVVEASIDDRTFGTKLSAMSAKMKAFGESVKSAGSRIRGMGMNLAIGSVLGAIPAALSVREFMRFDDVMRTVGANAKATEEDLRRLTEAALELGKTTSFTAVQVGEAQIELARADFSPDEIIAATEAILNLSRATGTDLTEATVIGSQILKAFGLDASEMGRVVDIATLSANDSIQDLQSYFEAMKFPQFWGQQAGMTIEEVSAAIGTLADSSLVGSLGGTGLRRIVADLSKPSAEAVAELQRLGVELKGVDGKLRNPIQIINEMFDAIKADGSDPLTSFATVFDVNGAGAALALTERRVLYEEKLNKLLNERNGIAERQAKAMDAGIGGAWRRMTSAINDFAIRAGEAMGGTFTKLFEGITFVANRLSEFVVRNPQIANMFLLLIAGSATAGVALIVLGTAISTVGGAIAAVISIGTSIAGLVSTIGIPILAIAAGVGLLVAALAAAAGIGAAMTLIFVDWKTALYEFDEIWKAFIKPFISNFSAIETFLRSGNLGKAGETAMLTLSLSFISGGRELLTHVESMLFNLVRAHAKAFVEIIKLGHRFHVEFAKAMLTGNGDPSSLLSLDGILSEIDAPLEAAERRLRKRLSELRKEAEVISKEEAEAKADADYMARLNSLESGEDGKLAADRDFMARLNALESGQGGAVLPPLDPKTQALIDDLNAGLQSWKDRTNALAAEMQRGMERMQVETSGISSGKAQLPLARYIDRQTDLLESIDTHLERIENKPAAGGMEWGA